MSDMKFRIQITIMLLIDAVVVNDLCIHRRVSAGENFCSSTLVLSFKEVLCLFLWRCYALFTSPNALAPGARAAGHPPLNTRLLVPAGDDPK